MVHAPGVPDLFDEIAGHYDLLNHLLSFWIDRGWRRKAIELLDPPAPPCILDVAAGTGDQALEAVKAGSLRVCGVDLSAHMLGRAQAKVSDRGLAGTVTLVMADAAALPFASATYDAVTCSFGVRNLDLLERALGEMLRVLRPGGQAVILEFSRPARFPITELYAFYLGRVVPLLGRLVSGHPRAYQRLPETIRVFPEREAFVEILLTSGFERVAHQPLTFGVACLYTGYAPVG